MGEEVLGADPTPNQVEVNEGNVTLATEMDEKTVPNLGKELDEPTKVGLTDSLNDTNGKVKEAEKMACSNVPKDAVDEWPVPKQTHSFHFIRVRSYEDPQLKTKIDQADKELQRKNQARYQIIESLKAKRSERSNLKSELQPFLAENKKYREAMEEKKKEIQPLQDDLRKFRTANNAARERGMGLCSSEEELNDFIKSLHYRIQHESNTLNEEKQLLKEIKQLEGTRDKVIANAAMKVEIEGSKDQKAAIQDRVKLLGVNMDDVRKEKQAVMANIKQLDEELKVIDTEIESLEEELRSVTERRDKAFETLTSLRKARDEANACFYQNRSLLNNARELAARNDISGLEELCTTEVEKFMLQWSANKSFRDDYERRILASLDSRQLSRDGRMRNPDEKPILVEAPPAAKVETSPLKITPKQGKDIIKPFTPQDIVSSNKIKGEELAKSNKADAGQPNSTEEIGKSQEAPKPRQIDPEKLKEMKREEEIAKAKLAMERKKKQAEKAAAKAAARAQKEAEKKLKEKEKKAKKKAGTTELAAPVEQTETEVKPPESEEADVKIEEKQVSEPRKEQPKVSARYRKQPQPKVKNPLPRVILKKKKSQSYMYLAIPAAVISAVVIMVLGYYSFGKEIRS